MDESVFVILLLLLPFASAGDEQENTESNFYLPDDLYPVKYTLTIFTKLEEDFEFRGNVIIEMICTSETETNKIVLHAKDLSIGDEDVTVKMVTSEGEEIEVGVKSHGSEDKNDFYSIFLTENLVQDNVYRVDISFRSVLNENLFGYYKTSYVEKESGLTKWMAVTKFSPNRARLCFPCMDEPAFKAKFKIYMGHAPNLQAISNMPIKENSDLVYNNESGWRMDEFEETVSMSTYLVAFALVEYEHVEWKLDDIGKTIGIWIRKELLDQVDLAKKTASGALVFYTNYFGINYELPKLDLVSVPQQGSSGLENYGIITLAESSITYDPKSSNVMDEYGTAQLICHEICHQWFGNYVTMKWWNDLWLKEGFASYFEDLCVGQVFPEWKSLDQMVFKKYLNALSADAVLSTHPIIVSITNPTDVDQIFDTITFDKAAFVIRMMKIFLGEDVFHKGLVNYLNRHKFKVATSDDLWNDMGEVALAANIPLEQLTIKQIMDSWTLNEGYPYIMVKVDYLSKTVTLTQEIYLSEELSESSEPPQHCWYVPISYVTSKEPKFDNAQPTKWLTCDGPLHIKVDIEEGQWILINIAVAGFYRTNYESQNYKALQQTLFANDPLNTIDILDRAQIIANSFGMSWNGHLDYETTFGIVKYLKNEAEYVPWRTALESLHDIRDLLLRTKIIQFFEDFVKSFLEPKFNFIGAMSNLPDDFMAYRYNTLIIYWACIYSVEKCHDQSIQIFQPWLDDPKPDENNPILPNLRDVVYCEAMKTGGEEVFNFMWDRYSNSNVPTEQLTILSAIGCTRDENLLVRFLEASIDSNKIRKQDSTRVYWSVATKKDGFELAKDFLFQRFTDIFNYHGHGNQSIGEYLEILAAMMISEEEMEEFDDFLKSNANQLEEYEFSVKKSTYSIKQNIAWENKHLNELIKLLTPSA